MAYGFSCLVVDGFRKYRIIHKRQHLLKVPSQALTEGRQVLENGWKYIIWGYVEKMSFSTASLRV